MRLGKRLAASLVLLAALGAPARPAGWTDKSPHSSAMVSANGIRLHYLDWGGSGEPILFLTGMGLTPHIYDDLAPRFASGHRVVGLTRRGLRPSDVPASGYDTGTLVQDIRAFLDAMKIDRVILIGHSFAGDEMTSFAALYPHRVRGLIYLDAAYDHSPVGPLSAKDPVENPPKKEDLASFEASKKWFQHVFGLWSDAVEADARVTNLKPDGSMSMESMPESVSRALFDEMASYHPDYSRLKAPILAFYAKPAKHPWILPENSDEMKKEGQEYWDRSWKPYVQAEIDRLTNSGARATVVVMTDTHHLCFLRPQDADLIAGVSRTFLEKMDRE